MRWDRFDDENCWHMKLKDDFSIDEKKKRNGNVEAIWERTEPLSVI